MQSVHRALDVLEALAAAGGTASLGDLAAACGLPAPTLHRLAGTLADRGYLRQLPDRRYSLGSRLVPLGADAHALLGARALPVLRALAELTGESANLAVLTQGLAEYVAQAPGRHTMRIFTEVGNRVELHCTGVGKALLAAVPPAQASQLIGAAPLAAQTAGTITDRPPCTPRSRSSAPAATPSTRARWRSASAASRSAWRAGPHGRLRVGPGGAHDRMT